MILITQAEAVRRLKVTGLSEATRLLAVKRMPKTLDGLREKVLARDVQNIINEINDIRERATISRPKIRPVSDAQRARVRI